MVGGRAECRGSVEAVGMSVSVKKGVVKTQPTDLLANDSSASAVRSVRWEQKEQDSTNPACVRRTGSPVQRGSRGRCGGNVLEIATGGATRDRNPPPFDRCRYGDWAALFVLGAGGL